MNERSRKQRMREMEHVWDSHEWLIHHSLDRIKERLQAVEREMRIVHVPRDISDRYIPEQMQQIFDSFMTELRKQYQGDESA